MKLIELLRVLDTYTRLFINALNIDKTKGNIIVGETSMKGWPDLMREIENAKCAEYMVTHIHGLWDAHELYIECVKCRNH